MSFNKGVRNVPEMFGSPENVLWFSSLLYIYKHIIRLGGGENIFTTIAPRRMIIIWHTLFVCRTVNSAFRTFDLQVINTSPVESDGCICDLIVNSEYGPEI